MGRVIFIAAIVLLVVWLLRRAVADGEAGRGGGAAQGDLVRCAHCGLYLPRAEAFGAGGRDFCGKEHARLGPRGG
ncbi:MAG TPA: PP0621 family protein [Burkholderiales bacterium]|nr:PP0621 family protein [Burkholderiales bacterium]